jgi:hypothetical protein
MKYDAHFPFREDNKLEFFERVERLFKQNLRPREASTASVH